MTAEVVAMNKEAVALASDSAGTLMTGSGPKVVTVNKLFALSNHPVGIMFYNNASFMEVPLEIIVRDYISHLPKNRFDTLDDYAKSFLSFLHNNQRIFPDYVQKRFFHNFINSYYVTINQEILNKVQSVIQKKGGIDDKTTSQIVSSLITKHHNNLRRAKRVIGRSFSAKTGREVALKYEDALHEAIQKTFQKLPLSKKSLEHLFTIAANVLSKATSDQFCGVVIAGFGDKEIFPKVKSFALEGLVTGKLVYTTAVEKRVDYDNRGMILAFAQREMVARFMEGVDPLHKQCEESYVLELCKQYAHAVAESVTGYTNIEKEKLRNELLGTGKALATDFQARMSTFRTEQFTKPVTALVSVLPKHDLATLAESLVSLTVLQRKFSTGPETVSEPIDVAVISKGDGFIWIKRKHYFKAEMNPQFFMRRYKES